MDEARCHDQRVTGPECEGFVAALPGSMLESDGVLREFFHENRDRFCRLSKVTYGCAVVTRYILSTWKGILSFLCFGFEAARNSIASDAALVRN